MKMMCAAWAKTDGDSCGGVVIALQSTKNAHITAAHQGCFLGNGRKMADFYEFFAGGGMARAGLGSRWSCLFANDISPKKAACYAANWGDAHLRIADIAELKTTDLPGVADLAWASFPCQDLSLAGSGAGLDGKRSGTFWPFWRLIKQLAAEYRSPRLIVLENVCGTLTSHGGQDFAAIAEAMSNAGYYFGAVIVNAVHFLPQSRPRLFMIAAKKTFPIPHAMIAKNPEKQWHPDMLTEAHGKLTATTQNDWIWWHLPPPPPRLSILADMVENEPTGVSWHTRAETEKLLSLMNPLNRAKVDAAKNTHMFQVGTVYKRTRPEGINGKKIQRAEIRFDNIAGCLRTPTGGSSRQTIMVIEGERIRSRLLSPREAARLMGLAETYVLPDHYNDAYQLAGDGVAVPVVRFLARHLLEPLLIPSEVLEKKAA